MGMKTRGACMLKECRTHGYFRAEECPICGEQGRFLMNDEELDKIGRTMAGVLRHFPERYGLKMDGHGWVDLNDFLNAVQVRQRRFRWLRSHHILAVIDTDPKGRYQFREGMIRATYAHSVNIDLDLPTRNVPEVLYYPATKEEKDILLETGLLPADRKMVHLSKTPESAIIAGKVRVPDPLVFAVDAVGVVQSGHAIKKAGNTVFVVDQVPPQFLRVLTEEEMPPSEGLEPEHKLMTEPKWKREKDEATVPRLAPEPEAEVLPPKPKPEPEPAPEEKPKRGPGRPKKAAAEAEPAPAEGEEPKKKRGRPKKVKEE
jgi:putative RNA 2'-phosphotransferase